MLRLFKFLSAALAGTIVYVLVSFTCGKDGLWAEDQLREQKRILSARADEIQRINESLFLEFTALEKDPDVIAGFARKMGYVRDGEKIVKIKGFVSSDDYHYETGTPVKYAEPYALPEWLCKVSGILMFFTAWLYISLRGLKSKAPAAEKKERAKKNKIKMRGIPVYDLPQV